MKDYKYLVDRKTIKMVPKAIAIELFIFNLISWTVMLCSIPLLLK